MPSFKEIAEGAAFDTTKTIRAICAHLVDERPFATSAPTPPKLPDLPAPAQAKALQRVMDLLADAGYTTPDKIRAASDEELRAIDGIGPQTLRQIRAQLASG